MYIIIVYEKAEQGKRSNVAWVLAEKAEHSDEVTARNVFQRYVEQSFNSIDPVKIVLNKDTHKLASFTLNKPF